MAAPLSPHLINRRISLPYIDGVVSAKLGPTRVRDKSEPAVFNRQIAMYLASRIGHWSTTVIGRFYNGRDHSTVCHAIHKIETLRRTDPKLHLLITGFAERLQGSRAADDASPLSHNVARTRSSLSQPELEEVASLVAEKVYAQLQQKLWDRLTGMQDHQSQVEELILGTEADNRC